MPRVRRAAARLAVLALIFTAVVAGGGGFRIETALITLSARGWRNPLVISLLAAALAWYASPRGNRLSTLAQDLQPVIRPVAPIVRGAWLGWRAIAPAASAVSPWVPGAVAAVLTVFVVTLGIVKGSFVAGGADSYGYVSQAHVWARGSVDVDEPMMREMRETITADAFAPMGWRPNQARDGIVPYYAPGFPIVMGLFARVAGPGAVFYAVPVLGGVAIWATFLLGRLMGGTWVGMSAALLLATSPIFLHQLTAAPMSDVPALAWWTLALALAVSSRRWLVFASGLAAGAAILTRPNLAPLAIVPFAVIASFRSTTDPAFSRRGLVRAAVFVAGMAPGALAVAWLNNYWYGSPTESGYGPLNDFFALEYWSVNLGHWASWLTETQTPLVAVALGAPWLAAQSTARPSSAFAARTVASMGLLFIGGIAALYLFYFPFDEWTYLRFLLPAYGALFACAVAAVAAAARRLPPTAGRLVTLLFVGLVTYQAVGVSRARDVVEWRVDRRFPAVGSYVKRRLPERAVMIAVHHSGSLRLYSGRQTIRWDWVDGTRLDDLLELLRARGDEPYLMLEYHEVEGFRTRFRDSGLLGVLDRPPVAQLPDESAKIYAFNAPPPTGTVTETIRDE
jgi:hypothetical protein